jgi:DNA repair protein RadA/Sms
MMGEVGLGGEVRAVTQAELRIKEAAKLGFKRCLLPERNLAKLDNLGSLGVELVGVEEIGEALEAALV